MTVGERVLAALDETLVQQIKGAADQEWLQVSSGESIDKSVEKFMVFLDKIVELHQKIRAAAEKKFVS
jgi:hypothetical protein